MCFSDTLLVNDTSVSRRWPWCHVQAYYMCEKCTFSTENNHTAVSGARAILCQASHNEHIFPRGCRWATQTHLLPFPAPLFLQFYEKVARVMNSDQERPFVCNAPGCSQVSVSGQKDTHRGVYRCAGVRVCACRFACNMKRCALRRPEERVTGEVLSVNKAAGVKKGLKAQCVTCKGICGHEIENTYVCI